MKKRKRFLPYMLLLPTFLGITLFSFYPFMKTIVSSFSLTNEYGEWIDWASTYFWKMMIQGGDGLFWKMIKATLVFSGLNFVFTFSAGMILALLCVKRGRFRKFYQTIFALPMAISSVTASIMWRFLTMGNGGLINTWLGMEVNWLGDERTAIWMLSIITSWCHLGGTFLLLLAGFRGVSEDVIEAAIVDGANGFVRAVKIMIPMASPQIFFVIFTTLLSSIKTFTQIQLLTGGGPSDSTRTLMFEIYVRGAELGEYEYACCASIVMFVVIFAITRIQFVFEKRLVHYQ